jgi:hypothetical protein
MCDNVVHVTPHTLCDDEALLDDSDIEEADGLQ